MKPRAIKLAIFDIDGTIFRSSLVIELSHALVDAKIFPLSAKKEISVRKDIEENLDQLKIGYYGLAGAFTEEAMLKYFGNVKDAKSYEEFENVFEHRSRTRNISKRQVEVGCLMVHLSRYAWMLQQRLDL